MISERVQTVKYEVIDVVSDQSQKIESQLDERFQSLQRQFLTQSDQKTAQSISESDLSNKIAEVKTLT